MPFSTGLARDPHSAFCTTAVSRAAGRWEPQPGGGGATPLRTRSPSPAAPRVAQQPVGSDVLRPGTRGGAGGLGLRALVWRPVSLRPARGLSPAAQARGELSSPPRALSAADPPATSRGRCCFSQQCQAGQGRVRRDGALAAHPDPESMVYGSRNCCHRDGPSQAHARPTQALPRGAAGAGQLPG